MANNFDDYKEQFYKNNTDILHENNSNSFHMLFLNREYKTPHDKKKKWDENVSKMKSVAKLILKNTRPIELSKQTLNISQTKLEEPQPRHSNCHARILDDLAIKEKNEEFQLSWNFNFPGTRDTKKNLKTTFYGKIISTICQIDNLEHILNLYVAGVELYLINLFYGSVESNLKLLKNLDICKKFCSYSRDSFISYTLLAIISPRVTITGCLRKNKKEVQLNFNDKIIVTADRKYFSLGSENVIFVNCAIILGVIKPNNYIHIDDITLRVIRKVKLSIECLIVQGGLLRPQRKVIFPSNLILNQVTAEELQDLTFCSKAHINTLVLPMPGCSAYYNSIRCAMVTLNCHNSRILAKVYQSLVWGKDYAKWIAQTYDGIILCIDENPKSHQIIQFTEEIRFLIKLCYDLKKPIIISNFLPKKCFESEIVTVSPEDYKNFFFYPDAILVQPNELTSVRISSLHSVCDDIMARITDFAMEDLTGPFEDKSFTGSDTIARSIVHISYTAKVDAIIVNTISGRMAEKISHFRPKCQIIALTKSIHVGRYLKIFHNINVAYYKEDDQNNTSLSTEERKVLNTKKLMFGILYGISKNIINVGANILYVCRTIPNTGYPNEIIKFKLETQTVDNIIERMI